MAERTPQVIEEIQKRFHALGTDTTRRVVRIVCADSAGTRRREQGLGYSESTGDASFHVIDTTFMDDSVYDARLLTKSNPQRLTLLDTIHLDTTFGDETFLPPAVSFFVEEGGRVKAEATRVSVIGTNGRKHTNGYKELRTAFAGRFSKVRRTKDAPFKLLEDVIREHLMKQYRVLCQQDPLEQDGAFSAPMRAAYNHRNLVKIAVREGLIAAQTSE